MNLKLNAVIGILVVGAAGQASAAITLGQAQGGSSLVLSVWDYTTNESYTRNLGPNLNGFLPTGLTTLPNDGNAVGTAVNGDKSPEAGLVVSFSGDALYTATFGNNDPANINWNIVAFDSVASIGGGLSRILTTANSAPRTTNAGIGIITFGIDNYLRSMIDNTTIGNVGVNSAAWTDPTVAAFAGNPGFGDTLNGGNLSTSTTGYSNSLSFYYLARTQVSGVNSTLATQRLFANSLNTAAWTLAANGTATYALAPIPEPAALWMLGAGLLGVLGVVRRRQATGAAA